MSPNASKQSTGKMANRPLFAHIQGGCTLRKDTFLPSKRLPSDFYKMLPSKNPSKNLVFAENAYQVPSKNSSKKHLLLENLPSTLLRSVLLHDPLGVHPLGNLLRTFLRTACCSMTPLVCILWLLEASAVRTARPNRIMKSALSG